MPVVEVEYRQPGSLVAGEAATFRGSHNVSLTEGDSVIIRCKVTARTWPGGQVARWPGGLVTPLLSQTDSNPPAAVSWRRAGVAGVWSTREEVLLERVGRAEAGLYTCTAHNTIGVSGPREISLNVECE